MFGCILGNRWQDNAFSYGLTILVVAVHNQSVYIRARVRFFACCLVIQVGIMDEERRTSLNLSACVSAASERLIFINTGFLDRCASEISSVSACGPILGKEAQKSEPWFQAYEENNVAVGLACGLPGKGQIGKGMWSAPDEMRKMLATKAVSELRITTSVILLC